MFKKYVLFPFKVAERLSIGKTLYNSLYHCVTVGGLSLLHWNKIHCLASHNSFVTRLYCEGLRSKPYGKNTDKNNAGSNLISMCKIVQSSFLKYFSRNVQSQGVAILGEIKFPPPSYIFAHGRYSMLGLHLLGN